MYFDETPLYSEVAPNLFMGGTHDDAVISFAAAPTTFQWKERIKFSLFKYRGVSDDK